MAHAILTVTCSGGTYFDRDHYVDVHLPLALACWQPHGLESASAFFPRDADAADVSVGIYRMPEGGRLLVIGSNTADSMPFPGLAAYVLTKAAMQGMARGLARDLGPREITVNVIQPGPTDTDMNPADGRRAAGMLEPMAIKRYGTADEVASLTLYLAGSQARGITGAMHTIDGGFAA